MNCYALRYIYGFQGELKQAHQQVVQAESMQAALRAKSSWPIEVRYNGTSAWAKNPGTSLYYVEAWEADCCPAPK